MSNFWQFFLQSLHLCLFFALKGAFCVIFSKKFPLLRGTQIFDFPLFTQDLFSKKIGLSWIVHYYEVSTTQAVTIKRVHCTSKITASIKTNNIPLERPIKLPPGMQKKILKFSKFLGF